MKKAANVLIGDNTEASIKETKKEMVEVEKEKLMNLKELGELTKEELLGIVNTMGKVNNKSSIEVMNQNGYAFTYAQLEIVAQYAGFIKDSGSSREVHYSAEDINERSPYKKEDDLGYEIYKRRKTVHNSELIRKSIYLFEKDLDGFSRMVDDNSEFGTRKIAQAVIFEKMLRSIN